MATSYSTPKPDPRPAFPIPNIPLLLTRFGDSAEPFVSAGLLSSYRSAITTLFTLEKAQILLDSLEKKETNWSNAWFIKLLLSARFAVATASRLSVLANVPGKNSSRSRKLAILLRAVGIWSREYVFKVEEKEVREERRNYTAAQELLEWQLRGLCGTFRVPVALDTCTLKYVGPEEARHAVIWCGGIAWKVQVVDEQGVVFSVSDIERQILEILKARHSNTSAIPRIAALSWRLDRSQWHAQKTGIDLIPENSAPLSTLYSSLVTVALEEYPAPAEISERLNDVRMGETSENRFADQTFGIVSYPDGEIGLAFDHVLSDCGAAMELSAILLGLSNSSALRFPVSKETAPTSLEPLRFSLPLHPQGLDSWQFPISLVESIPRKVITTNINPKSYLVSRIHVGARLCDTVVNLALQAAVYRIAGVVPPIFQPVQLKKFYLSRCDSMIPVSNESLAFVKLALLEQTEGDSAEEHIEELHNAFAAACKKRKEIISNTLDGMTTKYFRQGYFHPALLHMAGDSPEGPSEGLQAVLDVFHTVSGLHVEGNDRVPTTIQFTGFTTPVDGIDAGLSNIFLPNQLAVFYLQKPSGILTVSFSGTGVYCSQLESIVRSFEHSYEVISDIADEHVKRLAAVTPPPPIL